MSENAHVWVCPKCGSDKCYARFNDSVAGGVLMMACSSCGAGWPEPPLDHESRKPKAEPIIYLPASGYYDGSSPSWYDRFFFTAVVGLLGFFVGLIVRVCQK